MCWTGKTASVCAITSIPATWPMPRNCPRRWRASLALLDRNQIARDTVTLVLDKGSAALANTLELEKAGVGWISALPWNQAPAELRDRSVEQLPPCSSDQPGVRAAAEKMLVHGKEYLCVVKYSACFASEQLHSLTTTLSQGDCSTCAGWRPNCPSRRRASPKQGIRNKIARWLSDPFVSRSDPLRTGTARRPLASAVSSSTTRRSSSCGASSWPHRAAHQPHGLDRRTGGGRLLRPATDRACVSRTQRMATGWAGDRCTTGPTARSAFMLSTACWESRCSSTCIASPRTAGPGSDGTIAGRTEPDPAVRSALSAAGRQGSQPRRHGASKQTLAQQALAESLGLEQLCSTQRR